MSTSGDWIPLARPIIGAEEREAVDKVLASGSLAQGADVAAFEEEFAAAVGAPHAVAVNSGTSALHLMLLALGLGAGDDVIVPSFTFAATANSVALTGATPVFADIDPRTFCITADSVRAAATERTRAVMPVHLYGHPAPMTELRDLCLEQGWLLVEDAAQAHLATVDGRPVGTWGATAAFSFYPTKNMTTGEGGIVTAADPEVVRTIRLLRNQGMEARYQNEIVGFNTRMTNIAGAIGRVQLKKLPKWTESRIANASALSEGLADLADVETPYVDPSVVHVFHQYTIRLRRGAPEELQGHLKGLGIDSGVYYPVPVHRLRPFADQVAELPETDRAASSVLSLPVHPSLSADDLGRVAAGVRSFVSGKA